MRRIERKSVAAGRFHGAGPRFISSAVPDFIMARLCRAFLLMLSLSCITLAEDDEHHHMATGVPSHTPYGDLEDFTMFPTTEYVTDDDATSLDDHSGTPEPCKNKTTSPVPPVKVIGRMSYEGTTEDQFQTIGDEGVSITTLTSAASDDETGHQTETVPSTPLDVDDQGTEVTQTIAYLPARNFYHFIANFTRRSNYLKSTKTPIRHIGQLSYETTIEPRPDDHYESHVSQTTPDVTTEDDADDTPKTDDYTGVSMTPLDPEEDTTVTRHATVTEYPDQATDVPSTINYEAVGREYREGPMYMTTTTKAPVQHYGRLSYQTTVNLKPDDHYEDQSTETTPGLATELDEGGSTDGRTGVSMTPLDADDDDLSTVTSNPTLIQDYGHSTDGPSTTYYKAVARDSYEEPMYKTTTTTKAPVQYYGRLAYHTTMDYVPDDHREDQATETTLGTTEQDEAGRTDGHTSASVTPVDVEDGTVAVTGHSTVVDDHDQSADVPSATYKYVGRESYDGPMYKTTTTTKAPVQYYGRLGHHTTMDSIPEDHHDHHGTETTPGVTTILDDAGRTVDHTGASMTPLDADQDTTAVTGRTSSALDQDETTDALSTIHYKAAGRDNHEGPMYVTTTTKAPVQYYGRLVYHTTEDPKPDDHHEDKSTETTPGITTEQDQTGSSDGHAGFSMTPLDIEHEAATVTGHSTVEEERHRDRYTDVPSTTYKYVGRDSYEEPMYKTTTKAPVQKYGRRYERRTTMNLEYMDLGDHQPDSTVDFTVTAEGNVPTEHVTEVSATPSEIEDSSVSTTVDSTSVEPEDVNGLTMTSAGASAVPEDQDFYVDVTSRKYRKRKTRPPTKFYTRMFQRTTMTPEYQNGREAVHEATTDSSTLEPLEAVHTNPSTVIPQSTSEEFQPSQTVPTMSSLPEDDQDSTAFTQTTYKATEHPVYQDGHPYDTTVKQPQYVKTTKTPPVRYYGRLSHQSTMMPQESIYEDHGEHSSAVPTVTPDSTEPVSQTGSTILVDSTGYKERSQTPATGTTAFYEEESSSDEVPYETKQSDRPYNRNVAEYKTKEVPVVYRQRKFYQSTVIPDYHAIPNDIPDSTTTYQTDDDTDFLESSPSTIPSDAPQNPDTTLMTATKDPTSTEGYDHGYFHGTTIPIRRNIKMTTKASYHSRRVPDDLGREIHVERSGHWTPSETTDSTDEPEDDELATSDPSVTELEDDGDEPLATPTTLDPDSDEDPEDGTEPTMTTRPQGHGRHSYEHSQDPSLTYKQHVNATKAPVPVQVYGKLSQKSTIFPESRYNPEDGSKSTIHPSAEIPETLPAESITGVSSSALDDGQESTMTGTLTSGTPLPHGYRSTKDPAKYYGRLFESSTQVFQQGDALAEESSSEVPTNEGDQSQAPGEDHVTDSMMSIEQDITQEIPVQHEDFTVPATMEHPVEYPNYDGYY